MSLFEIEAREVSGEIRPFQPALTHRTQYRRAKPRDPRRQRRVSRLSSSIENSRVSSSISNLAACFSPLASWLAD